MAYSKIGFHVAANCGGCGGIEDYWRRLDAAGVPFVVYAANDGGLLAAAAQYSRATLIYRDVEASTVNPADYAADPERMAAVYWQRTLDSLPLTVMGLHGRVWLELLNEPGREDAQANWVGRLMYHMARLALADGWRVCGPGWAAGNPEPSAWRAAGWELYLRLCAAHPDRVAVSLHEYSLDNDIHAREPWLVGRFAQLFAACDELGVRRPPVFITEAGWTLDSMPPDAQAKRDIEYLAGLYAAHPQIKAANLWTLQSGRGNGDLPRRLNGLMGWLTEYTLATRFPDVDDEDDVDEPPPLGDGDDGGETPVTNLLENGSFEDGWTDSKTFPGQHPAGWRVEWNTGGEYPNPFSEWEYQIGEGVHKSGAMLPTAAERAAFIWDGQWTYKLFADQKSFWARLKQELELPAWRYRLSTPVWVDTYRWSGFKDYNVDPNHCQIMVKCNGVEARPWSLLVAGGRRAVVTEFDHDGGTAALAVHLRCNWPIENNLWLDGWSLVAVPVVEPPPAVKHKAIVVKLPQSMTADEWRRAADYAYQYRHTMTASHDDMLTILRGGNAQSYVKLAWPGRQADVAALIEAAGYTWQPLFDEPEEEPFRFKVYPVDAPRRVTQEFGARPEVYAQYGFPGHEGVDLAATLGAPVRAVADGHVGLISEAGNYGNWVNIVHAGGWQTTYAHLSRFGDIHAADAVRAGDVIGYAGSTGNSTGVHLHLGLKRAGQSFTDERGTVWPFNIFDPTPYLEPFLAEEEAVELLPYLRGDGRLYEVQHPGATETFQTQADGDWFYLVKNSQWEQLYADGDYIWRGADTSPGGGRFYVQFEPGLKRARWCPRRMEVGQTWVGPGHMVQFYDKSTCAKSAANSGNATNRMTFVARHERRTWNGVTVEDVIELTNGSERWFYGRGWGLVAWQSAWGGSAIAQVYRPGERPNLVREKINCQF